ncbi:MAG: RuvB, partial [uncultured Solirubrobacteraceae bacterium]
DPHPGTRREPHTDPRPDRRGRCDRDHAPAAEPRRVRRTGRHRRSAPGLDRGCRGAGRGTRPRAARRPARPGQDVARADPRGRARRRVRADRRARAGAQGGHRRVPHRAGTALDLLRRRDPPTVPRARGDVLPRDGGPSAPDHRRGGGRGAGHDARPAAVHPGGCHDARRPADDAPARPLRHPAPPRALRPARARDHRAPERRDPRRRARRRGRRGDRRSLPRHSARGQPPPQAGARLRGGPRRRRRDRRGRPPRARPAAGRPTRTRPPRSRDPRRDLREVRRWPRRTLDAGGDGGRGGRHARGRLRAVPADLRSAEAHPTRARGHPARLRAPRAGGARRGEAVL